MSFIETRDVLLVHPLFQVLTSALFGWSMYYIQELVTPTLARYVDNYTKKTKKDDGKFPSHVCNMFFHLPAAIASTYIMITERWLEDPSRAWDGYPTCKQLPITYVIYFYCCGYHWMRLFRLVANPGTDWIEMGAHHVLTVFLLTTSLLFNCLRVGILVLMVNEISDVFVYPAKIASILEMSKLQAFVTFPLLVSTWAYCRIYILALYVVPIAAAAPPACPYTVCGVGTYALWGLVALNLFWFGLFMKMAFRLVFKGETKDITDAVLATPAPGAKNNRNKIKSGFEESPKLK